MLLLCFFCSFLGDIYSFLDISSYCLKISSDFVEPLPQIFITNFGTFLPCSITFCLDSALGLRLYFKLCGIGLGLIFLISLFCYFSSSFSLFLNMSYNRMIINVFQVPVMQCIKVYLVAIFFS